MGQAGAIWLVFGITMLLSLLLYLPTSFVATTTACNHRQKHIGAADGLLPLPTPLSSG
ncbi:hypothetical protein M441DRAFT_53010 [Trichoderma asperellum CBS 433.97]|uniref:Uncharacterized protein n=1 Tax=Trichoderma asperellum (strain ATCC 204424 / CBS 433.97 / NBRC 101777) TaxID=1042311 RepID=A0A2T3ZN76_TRIA4|nr:hypothetical protein M441DRAFT_53010 [Trichoderma asperellum CBS 433.97]PTB46257.1 hypothetical protein M441DRAFT_53010 [Trichoderma asperellum CBS 433.97]